MLVSHLLSTILLKSVLTLPLEEGQYVNLDPAAEANEYEPDVDIQDLISLEDVMDEMGLGPNGGLMACFEFLNENLDWFDQALGPSDEEYLTIFDLPGQIELYTHSPVLPELIRHLKRNMDFSLCVVYLMESTFIVDRAKYFAGTLSAMSAMLMLECPHINVLSKMDLMKNQVSKRELKRYIDPDPTVMAEEATKDTNPRWYDLNLSVVNLIENFSMVQYLQLNAQDEDSVRAVLSYVDNMTGWSEVQEPKMPEQEEQEMEAAEE